MLMVIMSRLFEIFADGEASGNAINKPAEQYHTGNDDDDPLRIDDAGDIVDMDAVAREARGK